MSETYPPFIQAVTDNGGDTFSAALSEPGAFRNYFLEHLVAAAETLGRPVWPVGYGMEGAFLLGVVGWGGYGYDDTAGTWHQSTWFGDPADPGGDVVVFGLDQARVDLEKAAAEAHGLTVVRTVRMSDDTVVDY